MISPHAAPRLPQSVIRCHNLTFDRIGERNVVAKVLLVARKSGAKTSYKVRVFDCCTCAHERSLGGQ